MQRQRLFGVLVVVLVVGGLVLFFRGGGEEEEISFESEEGQVEEVARELSAQLGVSVAEGVERISLRDVTGGSASGLATRDFREGRFDHTVLAALPDLVSNTFYEGWLVRGSEGDEDFSIVGTGRLRRSKGGYLLDHTSSEDLGDHSVVWVTLETTDDSKPEARVLEGSF